METWTADQCADAWNIKLSTWRAYVSTGHAPQPIPGYDPTTGRRRWSVDEVHAFPRPGRGHRRLARTNLHHTDTTGDTP